MLASVTIVRLRPSTHTDHPVPALYCAATVKAQNASKAIELLRDQDLYDIPKHLKAIRKGQGDNAGTVSILLCRNSDQNAKHMLGQILTELLIEDRLITVMVPENQPRCKDQLQEFGKLWPVNFLADIYSRDQPHSKLEQQIITECAILRKWTIFDSKGVAFSLSYEGLCQEQKVHTHPIMVLLREWSQLPLYAQRGCYYLTGFSAILPSQICGMCSMALVHSRVARVYQLDGSPEYGYILQNWRLNHRVDLYSVVQGQDKQNCSDEKEEL